MSVKSRGSSTEDDLLGSQMESDNSSTSDENFPSTYTLSEPMCVSHPAAQTGPYAHPTTNNAGFNPHYPHSHCQQKSLNNQEMIYPQPSGAPAGLTHRCVVCGRFRSLSFHYRYPIAPGQTPPITICRKCQAYTTSSDESDSDSDDRGRSFKGKKSNRRKKTKSRSESRGQQKERRASVYSKDSQDKKQGETLPDPTIKPIATGTYSPNLADAQQNSEKQYHHNQSREPSFPGLSTQPAPAAEQETNRMNPNNENSSKMHPEAQSNQYYIPTSWNLTNPFGP